MPNYYDNNYLCIQERADTEGMWHTVTMIVPGATAEDAANKMLSFSHLQDGWKIRSIKVVPLSQVQGWEVNESPAWKLGRQL